MSSNFLSVLITFLWTNFSPPTITRMDDNDDEDGHWIKNFLRHKETLISLGYCIMRENHHHFSSFMLLYICHDYCHKKLHSINRWKNFFLPTEKILCNKEFSYSWKNIFIISLIREMQSNERKCIKFCRAK